MTKIQILIGIFSSMVLNTYAQQTPIQLDRPDQTECPFIVPKNWIQLENGANFEKITTTDEKIVHPTILWKYGINERCEFRLITELNTFRNTQNSTSITGIKPITVGFKSLLIKEKGIVPQTAFIGHITTAKLGSEALRSTYIAPSFRFLMQHTISPKIVLAYNLGAEWNGETGAHSYLYTLTTGLTITEKLGAYAELYGFLPAKQNADHRCDAGFTYLLNNNSMLDLSGGFGLSASSPKSYLSLGYSFRFNTRRNYLQSRK